MSYLDKKRSYGEDNFKQDYPFKIFEATFDENVQNSAFSDVFVDLRKNIFSKNSNLEFSYIYNLTTRKWKRYQPNTQIEPGEYVLSQPDDNGNISVYNNTFSLLSDLNVPKDCIFFLNNNSLFIFNSSKLCFVRVVFNGKIFIQQMLAFSDVSSLFPGVQVINIDSYSSYNIYIEKDNQKASFIILSKYSQGYDKYILTPIKGQFNQTFLPNMFTVSSNDDVVISYHNKDVDPEATSETTPSYRFVFHTRGHQTPLENPSSQYVQYDEQTASQEYEEDFKPNIMPKIDNAPKEIETLSLPPQQNIEPPGEE